jgi:predicted nucleotidyltransferase
LQKSKVASVRIFGATLKREAIDDSDNLGRVTEVAYEFSGRPRTWMAEEKAAF